jgi:hypothetical protein
MQEEDMKLFRLASREERVDFCDRCGKVCDAHCRASFARERAIERALYGGFGRR